MCGLQDGGEGEDCGASEACVRGGESAGTGPGESSNGGKQGQGRLATDDC